MLMEPLEYNLLVRWFVGLHMDDPVWDPTVFSKNRDRLLAADGAALFLPQVLEEAKAQDLVSDEHFTVDGTLREAWASRKSLHPVGAAAPPPADDPGNPPVNFHGETRSNATQASTTDPDARLARTGAGKAAKLRDTGHVLMENRNGLVVDATVRFATGTAERAAAWDRAAQIPGDRRVTIGGDKHSDPADRVEKWRDLNVTPHVAQNHQHRRRAIDQRTTRHPGYRISQMTRKRVEAIVGWLKTGGGFRKLRHRGVERVEGMFTLGVAAYNWVRIRNLAPADS